MRGTVGKDEWESYTLKDMFNAILVINWIRNGAEYADLEEKLFLKEVLENITVC